MVVRNLQHMIQTSWVQLVSAVFIVSFLVLFANILVISAKRMQLVSSSVKEKLGVYFYLDDSSSQKDTVYTKTIALIDELEQVGLQVDFYSKEDAFKLLETRLPNVIGNLERYGIDNPLPPTLYVTFRNQQDYELLKSLIFRYEDIVMNLEDLSAGWSFSQQESRVARVISLTNFVTYLAYFLIAVIVVIIVAFLFYATKINFSRFRQQIELEKLLGATYTQIKSPFLLYVVVTLLGGFVLAAIYLFGIFSYLNTFFVDVFGASIYFVLMDQGQIMGLLLLELVLIVALNVLFTHISLERLIGKV